MTLPPSRVNTNVVLPAAVVKLPFQCWSASGPLTARTLLAAERTYAAWVRTGLAALAAGIGAKALLQDLVHGWLVLTTSIVLIAFAEFCFIAGVWRQFTRAVPPPRPDTARLPAWLLVTFNGFLVVLGAAVLIGIVSR